MALSSSKAAMTSLAAPANSIIVTDRQGRRRSSRAGRIGSWPRNSLAFEPGLAASMVISELLDGLVDRRPWPASRGRARAAMASRGALALRSGLGEVEELRGVFGREGVEPADRLVDREEGEHVAAGDRAPGTGRRAQSCLAELLGRVTAHRRGRPRRRSCRGR